MGIGITYYYATVYITLFIIVLTPQYSITINEESEGLTEPNLKFNETGIEIRKVPEIAIGVARKK